jgi:hypothetical protein
MRRWAALFADLEGQLAAEDAAVFAAEAAERTRWEAGQVTLTEQLGWLLGGELDARIEGAGRLGAELVGVGPDWLLLRDPAQRELLASTRALLSVRLTTAPVGASAAGAPAAGRLDLRRALRQLARDRARVSVVLRDGSVIAGTIDRVGTDYVGLAAHPPDQPRRAGSVRHSALVALSAVALVRAEEQ